MIFCPLCPVHIAHLNSVENTENSEKKDFRYLALSFKTRRTLTYIQLANYLTPWLQNPKVRRRIHNSPPTVPILSPPQHISLKSILIPSCHLRLGLSSGLFTTGFPTKTLYTFFPVSCLYPTTYEIFVVELCNILYN
jgi:hypothetical protein